MTTPPPPREHPGIVTIASHYSAAEVLDRLAAIATARGITIFARIEFTKDATAAGMPLRPMAQLVFGNPRAGTPVLAAAPLTGLDLPLRVLAWTDEKGQTWLSYRDPAAMLAGYEVSAEAVAGLGGIHALCRAAAV